MNKAFNIFITIVLIANIIFAIVNEPSKLITVLAWISNLVWFLTGYISKVHDKEENNA